MRTNATSTQRMEQKQNILGTSNILDKRKTEKRINSLLVSSREKKLQCWFWSSHFAFCFSRFHQLLVLISRNKKKSYIRRKWQHICDEPARVAETSQKTQANTINCSNANSIVPLCHLLAWSNEKPRGSVVAQAIRSQKRMVEKQMTLCANIKCFRLHEERAHRLHLTILARTS